MTDILINGEKKTTINVSDRGLQYGDGLFETMAVHNGKVNLWEDHWQRLKSGCERLWISLPDKKIVEKEIKSLCKNDNDDKFVIKLIVTRGEGQRGYCFSENQNVTRILGIHAWPDYPEKNTTEGVAVRYCDTVLSENPRLAGIKHLNRLEQVLARNEWNDNEYQEGLMLNLHGDVIDGTMSNIFMVKDSKIFTPDLSLSGVAGVMRKNIIKLAEKIKLSVCIEKLDKNKLENADELFLTNSLFGIWPVESLGDNTFPKIRVITKALQKEVSKQGC